MLYGVQFRSMHTAMHHVVVFEKAGRARQLLNQMEVSETIPEEASGYLEIKEINFRNPPTHVSGQRLKIVNNQGNSIRIPDIYNY